MVIFLLICATTWTLNVAVDVPLHGPSPGRAAPSGRSAKAAPMKMMIDMRGFPDLEGNCFRGEGFYRNKTDCTQFYRCVDYYQKKRYTFYRFMCGPMTVFDESRSLCTGPDMAVPKCNETISSTERPVTDATDTTFTTTPTTTTDSPVIESSTTTPTTTTAEVVTVSQVVTDSTPITTTQGVIPTDSSPTTTTETTTVVTQTESSTTTQSTVTGEVSSSTESTPDPTTETSTSASTISTEYPDENCSLDSGRTCRPVTEETTTPTPLPDTTTPVTGTSTTGEVGSTPESTSDATPETSTISTESPNIPDDNCPPGSGRTCRPVTEETTTPSSLPDTTPGTGTSTTGGVGSTPESTSDVTPETSTISTESTNIPDENCPPGSGLTCRPVTLETTTPTPLPDTTTPGTGTEASTGSSSTTSSTDVVTDSTPKDPDTSTITTTEGTTPTPVADEIKIITAVDQESGITTPEQAVISTDKQFGVLVQKDAVITIDGAAIKIPASSVLVFEAQQDGSVSNVINGFTTSSSTVNLAQGTKVYVYKYNSYGEIVSKEQIAVTQWTTTFSIPEKSPAGYLVINSQNKVYSIGKWIYSYVYITQLTQITYYQVISSVTTTQVTVQTESKGVSGSGSFISGILTVGSSKIETVTSNTVVKETQEFAIIPPGGKGIVTVTEESGEILELNVQPGMMVTVQVSGGSGVVTNIQQQLTSSTTLMRFPAGSVVSVVRITTSGKMETVSSYTLKTTSTVTTATQSLTGVLTTNQGVVTMFGQASFTVQELVNPSETVYLGVINLSQITSTEESTTTSSTTTTTTTTQRPTKPSVDIIEIPCPISDPNDFSKFSLHEYPYDCSKFTQCLRQQGEDVQFFVFPCASGLYFNSATSTCDRRENVQCDVSALSTNTSNGVYGIQCTGEMYRYPINCQAFYQCIAVDDNPESVTMFLYSCADGLVFDEERRSCLKPEETASCEDDVFRSTEYEFNEDAPIDTSAIYRLSQELHSKTDITKQIENRSLHPHHAGRGAASKQVMIRMSAGGINGRLHVASYP